MLTLPVDQKIDSLLPDDAAVRPEPRPRRVAVASRPWAWSSQDGGLRASMYVVSGVAVVTVEGYLNQDAIRVCRSALEAALRLRTRQVVLDLQQARIDEESRPVLGLMDRMCRRRGASLWLVGLTIPARGVLRTDRTAAYRVFPTVSAALTEAATMRPRQY